MLDSTVLPVAPYGLPPLASSRPPLLIGGTANGSWTLLAEALLASASSRVSGAAAIQKSLGGNDNEKAQWLLLIERPDVMLARWQRTGEPGQLVRTLDNWCSSARSAFALAVTRGRDVLLLPADAGPDDEAWIVELLADWDPRLARMRLDLPESPPADAQALDIAQRICRARPDVRRIYEALQARSNRLPPLTSTPIARPESALQWARTMGPSSNTHACAGGEDALESVTQRLHETQRELEFVYLELQEMRVARRSGVAGRGMLRAGHARLVFADESDAAQLQLELRQLDLGVRVLPRARAALVRQDGQPGLRLYASGSEPELVSAWRANGSDDSGSFMQFVPAFAADRRRLQFLGAGDWRVVSGMVSLLRAEIETMGDAVPASWRIASAHLSRLLDELPARFRYDGLMVATTTAPDGSAGLDVRFTGAGHAGLQLGTVWLNWSPRGLWWLLGTEPQMLPLAAWPIADDGKPEPQIQLPVGRLDAFSKVRMWRAMSEGDRALLLAVLDALPALVPLASREGADFGGAAKLRGALRALLREGHRAVIAGRLRRQFAALPGIGRLLSADTA